ncbi:MAG: DUF6702 family protein [Pseudomonadota bacterium]
MAVLTAAATTRVHAHDAAFALTTIEWNDAAGALEIIHRLHTHDAAHAAMLTQDTADHSVMGPKNLAALGLYVERRFGLFNNQGIPIEVEFVGAEMQGDYALVYQEAALKRAPASLGVRNDLLNDIQSDQINHVNITLHEQTRTLVFTNENQLAFWKNPAP